MDERHNNTPIEIILSQFLPLLEDRYPGKDDLKNYLTCAEFEQFQKELTGILMRLEQLEQRVADQSELNQKKRELEETQKLMKAAQNQAQKQAAELDNAHKRINQLAGENKQLSSVNDRLRNEKTELVQSNGDLQSSNRDLQSKVDELNTHSELIKNIPIEYQPLLAGWKSAHQAAERASFLDNQLKYFSDKQGLFHFWLFCSDCNNLEILYKSACTNYRLLEERTEYRENIELLLSFCMQACGLADGQRYCWMSTEKGNQFSSELHHNVESLRSGRHVIQAVLLDGIYRGSSVLCPAIVRATPAH